jgi:hypothetical protein
VHRAAASRILAVPFSAIANVAITQCPEDFWLGLFGQHVVGDSEEILQSSFQDMAFEEITPVMSPSH